MQGAASSHFVKALPLADWLVPPASREQRRAVGAIWRERLRLPPEGFVHLRRSSPCIVDALARPLREVSVRLTQLAQIDNSVSFPNSQLNTLCTFSHWDNGRGKAFNEDFMDQASGCLMNCKERCQFCFLLFHKIDCLLY